LVGALAIALGIIARVLIAARRVLPPLLEAVARTCSPEVFLVSVMAIVFATAYLTSLAGLSVSLGAFLAGLMVSESRFGQHALGEILPLQIIFSGVFFVSVGMLLDLGFVVDNLGLVLAALAVVLAIKVVATVASARARHRTSGGGVARMPDRCARAHHPYRADPAVRAGGRDLRAHLPSTRNPPARCRLRGLLLMGGEWVHLRTRLECGHVGCCDSSPNRHASKHSSSTGHPMMVSLEPKDDWAWCYVDKLRMHGRRSTVKRPDAD